MARMIPAAVDLGDLPPGEKMVYEQLAEDPATEGWVILHSFDLPRHVDQFQGEIDFVVIIPDLGVVSLEVKSHTSVKRREDGMWLLGADRPWAKGPFKQSSTANFSLLAEVKRRGNHLGAIPFVSAVCFPRCAFEVPAIEWDDWQVIDEPAMTRKPLSYLLAAVLHNARAKYGEQGATWLTGEAPNASQMTALVTLLRPRFEVFQSPGSRARELTKELRRYTLEQAESLDVCELNHRVLLQGGAGTGKTLLAIEQARRFALGGDRVLLCCFNQNLGKWIRSEFDPGDLSVTIQTIHSLMLEIAGLSPPAGAGSRFWNQDLPEAALTALLDGDEMAGSFSSIVVDEAQDVLYQPFVDVLDLLLEGGIAEGRMILFADFEWQAIFRHGRSNPEDVLSADFPGITRYPLHVNCRNVSRIGAFITTMVGDSDLYRSYRRGDNGVEPDTRIWKSDSEQVMMLEQTLDAMVAEGFAAENIAVLSFLADDAAAAGRLSQRWTSRIRPMGLAKAGHGRRSSVAAFKGLEAPAVVLTDITSIATRWEESLLYIGASRALDRLVVLAGQSARDDLRRMILGG